MKSCGFVWPLGLLVIAASEIEAQLKRDHARDAVAAKTHAQESSGRRSGV